jgi:hypothetical protein
LQAFVTAASGLNILLFAGVAGLVALYWRRCLRSPWPLVLAVTLGFLWQPMSIELASAVLSEPLFTLLLWLAMVGVAWRVDRSPDDARGYLALGMIVGAAMLTRYAALSLVAALGTWSILEKRWKPLGAASLGFLVVWGPWVLFRALEPGEPYVANFFRSVTGLGLTGGAGRALALSGCLSFVQAIPGFFWDRWAHVLPVDGGARFLGWLAVGVGALLVLAVVHAFRDAFRAETASLDRLAALLVGFTVLMDIVWSAGYPDLGAWQHARLILPVLPFLFQLLLRPWRSATHAAPWRPVLALTVVAGVAFVSSSQLASLRATIEQNHTFAMDDVVTAIHLLTEPGDVIVTRYPPAIQLRTGLRTFQWIADHRYILSSLVRYRRVWLMVDYQSETLDWDSLSSKNPQIAFVSAMARAYPGVLRIAYRNVESGISLYEVDRKRLLAQMKQNPSGRTPHVHS